jgi:hypothetical protein
MTERRSVQMITAGRKGDLAHEQNGHGIFTQYLLRGLTGEADLNGDGLVTASELGSFVQPNVYRASGQKQFPQYGRLDGEGEVVFVAGEEPRLKQAKERLTALEKEVTALREQRKSLEGKKELLLTDIMKLDVEIRQIRERTEGVEKEMASLKATVEGRQTSPPAAVPRPAQETATPSPAPQLPQPQPSPPVRFADNGNSTITDTQTGLMWQKAGSEETMSYVAGLEYVRRLNQEKWAGHSDWRIPVLQELQGLLLDAPTRGARLDPAFSRQILLCWSSTEYPVSHLKHFVGVDLKDGSSLARSEQSDLYHIRAVRGPVESLKSSKGK